MIPCGPEQIAAMNKAFKDETRRRQVLAIGGNPLGQVFLLLDDGSVVGLTSGLVSQVVAVHNDGVAVGAASKDN